jgi:nucleoside 2-deoxyribosyltransferase
MPIASMDGLPADHWLEVKSIIIDALNTIESPKFTTALVSESDDVGVIHKRIVQGVYQADIVVCDVSGKNPNVLFELGMRLAFDKPTVIIKDDKTDYMFDTGVIEHLTYPRDLRFQRIVAFKEILAKKVHATYIAATTDQEHSTFLKSFGTFKVAQLNEKEASAETVMFEMLADMQRELRALRRNSISISPRNFDPKFTSTEEIYDLISKAESLLKFGGSDAWRELETLRTPLLHLSRIKNIPHPMREKIEEIISAMSSINIPVNELGRTDNQKQ